MSAQVEPRLTLGRDFARALDPVIFANDCGIVPDAWQAELLRSTSRRVLLLCSRQSGKSTVTALLALWIAIFEAPSLIIVVSPSQRQSAETLRTIMWLHCKLEGAPALDGPGSVLKAEFSNGSRILALPGTERTIRGLAGVAVVILDEASRVDDDLIAAVRPMLATSEGGGRLIGLSTPAGRRGWFYEAWHDTAEGNNWTRVRVSAADCPRISQEFLDEEMRELGPLRYSEEYLLEFRDDNESVFLGDLIDRAFSTEVLPLWT
jgi:Terminase large subunit, T4likevirus-type, N-terminal